METVYKTRENILSIFSSTFTCQIQAAKQKSPKAFPQAASISFNGRIPMYFLANVPWRSDVAQNICCT